MRQKNNIFDYEENVYYILSMNFRTDDTPTFQRTDWRTYRYEIVLENDVYTFTGVIGGKNEHHVKEEIQRRYAVMIKEYKLDVISENHYEYVINEIRSDR